MTVHVGATLDRTPGHRYAESLHFAELAFRGPLPRPATLARWRGEARPELRVSLVVPKDCVVAKTGALRLDALEPRLEWLRNAAKALEAVALVVSTGSDVTPGQRDRDRLAAYFDALRKHHACALVWAPAGLWEHEIAARSAERFEVTLAFDPLEDDVPSSTTTAYARLRTLGARSRISTGMLVEAADAIADARANTIYVAIASATAVRDARALQSLIAGSAVDHEDEEDELPEEE